LEGEVQVKKSEKNEYENAIWGMQLFEGDQIRTGLNAQVSLLFQNNSLIMLGQGSSLTISQNPSYGRQNHPEVKKMESALLSDLPVFSLRESSKGEMGLLAGLRSQNDDAIILIEPRNSKIMSREPTFKWNCDQSFDYFEISLYNEEGKLWSREAEQKYLDFPADAQPLGHSQSYFWYVEGKSLFESVKSQSVGFRIASPEDSLRIQQRKDKLSEAFEQDTSRNGYRLILASFLEKEGFFQDAIYHFSLIAESYPDSPLSHQLLGNLYAKIGLKDTAILELNKAVELSQ
jgi:hypothetical protein